MLQLIEKATPYQKNKMLSCIKTQPMRLMARVIREQFLLLLVLCLVPPALAAHESGPVGPYNVSFDVNTTMDYKVIVEPSSSGQTSMGVDFVRYNMTIDSEDYAAWLVFTRYEEPMVANITANEYIVYSALIDSGADVPNLYQVEMDGQPAVVGNFRFQRQFLGEGRYQEGDLVVAAAYSPDARLYDDGIYRGKNDFRIISTYPWEIIRDLLYTLHVEVPAEDRLPINLSNPINESSERN